MSLRQQVKAVTHAVELLSFVQDRVKGMATRFPEKPKERELQMG